MGFFTNTRTKCPRGLLRFLPPGGLAGSGAYPDRPRPALTTCSIRRTEPPGTGGQATSAGLRLSQGSPASPTRPGRVRGFQIPKRKRNAPASGSRRHLNLESAAADLTWSCVSALHAGYIRWFIIQGPDPLSDFLFYGFPPGISILGPNTQPLLKPPRN